MGSVDPEGSVGVIKVYERCHKVRSGAWEGCMGSVGKMLYRSERGVKDGMGWEGCLGLLWSVREVLCRSGMVCGGMIWVEKVVCECP